MDSNSEIEGLTKVLITCINSLSKPRLRIDIAVSQFIWHEFYECTKERGPILTIHLSLIQIKSFLWFNITFILSWGILCLFHCNDGWIFLLSNSRVLRIPPGFPFEVCTSCLISTLWFLSWLKVLINVLIVVWLPLILFSTIVFINVRIRGESVCLSFISRDFYKTKGFK